MTTPRAGRKSWYIIILLLIVLNLVLSLFIILNTRILFMITIGNESKCIENQAALYSKRTLMTQEKNRRREVIS